MWKTFKHKTLLSKWLQNQSKAIKYQDALFQKALLSRLLLSQPSQQISHFQIKEQILNMTMQQQQLYANNHYIEYVHRKLFSLHHHSKGRNMISSFSTANQREGLIDPDKFPIFDLKETIPKFRNNWKQLMGLIRYDVGFELVVKQSQIDHPQSGNGLYLKLSTFNPKIGIGSCLGFLPGIVYSNILEFTKIKLKNLSSYQKTPSYLEFPTSKILQLSQLNPPQSPYEIQPQYLNPFALGHLINHPPPGKPANVCFVEIAIPSIFFPKYLLKHLPYNYQLIQKNTLPVFMIVAIQELQNNQELYVDYNTQYVFDTKPQWLIEIPENKYFKKGEYQEVSTIYWDYMQKTQHQKVDLYKPGKIILQNQKGIYRAMYNSKSKNDK